MYLIFISLYNFILIIIFIIILLEMDDIMKNIKIKKLVVKHCIISWIERIVICCLLITFLLSLRNIISWQSDNGKIESVSKKISELVDVNEVIIPVDESTESLYDIEEQYWRYKDVPIMDVNIDRLKLENSATVGWIKVNGTNINYPIVQASDNEYFLYHDFEGNYNIGGWIFADYRINLNNLSQNNIIYGHRRLNQSMFGTLKNVLTDEWINNKENHIIKVSTDKYNYLFQVFSVYTIDNETYYLKTSFNNDNEFQTIIDTIKKRSNYDFQIDVNTDDKILTLSTCDLLNADKRLVVHSKLVRSIEKN